MSFILPASATSCLRSSGRPNTCPPMCRAPCRCWSARRHAGVKVRLRGLLVLLRARRDADHGRPPDPPAIPLRARKYQGEQAALHWHKVYRLPVNSIRIFNAYGTRSRTSGAYGAVFGVFLRQKLAGKPFTVVGDGTQRRDFLYASDVAAAFLAAAETPVRAGLQRRRRQSADRQPAGRAARRRVRSTFPSGRANPIAPGPTSPASRPNWAGSPRFPSRKVCAGARQHRLLAQRPAVGPGIDRQGDPDLVHLSRLGRRDRGKTGRYPDDTSSRRLSRPGRTCGRRSCGSRAASARRLRFRQPEDDVPPRVQDHDMDVPGHDARLPQQDVHSE